MLLDPLGRGAERGSDRSLCGLVVVGSGDAGVLQGGKFLFQPLDANAGLGQFVGDRERRHHGEPGIADLAEFRAQPADARIEIAREIHEVALLAVLAGHPELPAVDGDADLGHLLDPPLRPRALLGSQSPNSRTPRMVSMAWSIRCATSRLAVSSARARAAASSSSLASRARSRAERMDLIGERFLAAIGLAPPLGCGLQCVERKRQPALRDVNRIGVAHLAFRSQAIRLAHWPRKLCDGNRLSRRTLRRIDGKASTLARRRWPVHDACARGGRGIDYGCPPCYLCPACSRDF